MTKTFLTETSAHSLLENSFSIGRTRPFCVTSERRSNGKLVYDVHVSASTAPLGYASQLKRKLRGVSPDLNVRVRRLGNRHLWRSTNLAALVKPFRGGDIELDPTGAVGRSRDLVQIAEALRFELGAGVKGFYWEPAARVLFVVFDPKTHVCDGRAKTDRLKALETTVRRVLLEHAGPEASRYIVGVRLGFHVPSGNLVPLDLRSYRTRRHPPVWRRFGRNSTLALVLGVSVPTAAAAQQATQISPAVSAPNWDLGLSGGSRDGDGAFMFEGSYTAPIDFATGFRIDGAAGGTSEGFQGGVGIHYFRRDPSTGLLGGYVNWSTVDPNDGVDDQKSIFEVAAQSETYYDEFTLVALGGVQFGSDIDDGLFGKLQVEWYATDDFMVSAGGRWDPEREGLGLLGAEYQPAYLAMPGLTFFAEGAVGGNDYEHVFGGIRFYFGAPKSLKDRHRYDTFRTTANRGVMGAAIPTREPASGGCVP